MDCSEFQDGSAWNAWISVFLVIGIYASYIPQQINVVRRRTVEGLSLSFLFLMNLGAAFGLANILIVSKPVYKCCAAELTLVQCSNAIMGVGQMTSAFLGPALVLVFAAIYARSSKDEEDSLRKLVTWTGVITGVLGVAVIYSLNTPRGTTVAYLFGLIATVVGLVQYLPQLWTTFKLKHAGTLSLMTLLIQIPGGMIWSLSLAARDEVNWSVWFPIFLAACLQIVLLCMAFYFSLCKINCDVAQITKTPSPMSTQIEESEEELEQV